MDRAQILGLLCQGCSVAAISRRCGVGPEAVSALKADGARAAVWYQDRVLRKLTTRRIRIDVLCGFGVRRRRKAESAGPAGKQVDEIWTWTAIDPDSKLIVAWLVGDRDSETAEFFIGEVASRLTDPVTLRAVEDIAFLEAVGDEGGAGFDEDILARLYGVPEAAAVDAEPLIEAPWGPNDRIRVRTPARLTMGRARQVEDHAQGLALSALHKNFVRVDRVSGLTPGMAAGIVDVPWNLRSIEAVVTLWENLKTGPWYERLVVLSGS